MMSLIVNILYKFCIHFKVSVVTSVYKYGIDVLDTNYSFSRLVTVFS